MSAMTSARQRNFASRSDKQDEKLFVFGYSCKIFRDDEKATFIDQGKHLIPWMGDKNVMIDRYDVRGYLHDLKPYEASPHYSDDLSEDEKQMEKLCDEERYLALRTDLTEEQMYQEEELKRLRAAVAGDGAYHEIGFTYDDPVNIGSENQYSSAIKEDLDDEPYKIPLDLHIPKGIEVPSNMKIHAIIEKTATFVSQQGGQMEIIIKMKQSNNPQFAFMHLENPLYPYYKHLVKEIKAGKYKPPETKKPVRETDDEDEDDHYLHPSLMSGKPDLIPKFTVPTISFRRTNDDSYSMLVKNLRQRIIDDTRSSSPSSQPGQENSNTGSPLTADENSNQPHASDSETEESKSEQPPPPGEEKSKFGDEDGRSMSSSSSDVSDSPLTDSSDDEKEPKPAPKVIPPPPNIKPIIDKMAEYVAKNGGDFEYVVKSKNDKRFDFLHDWHEYHQYYLMKRNEALDRLKPPPEEKPPDEPAPTENAVVKSDPETNSNNPDAENSEQNHLSSQNASVTVEESAPISGGESASVSDENCAPSYNEENTVDFSKNNVVGSVEDDSKPNEVPSGDKAVEVDETSQCSVGVEAKTTPAEEDNNIKEEKSVKAVTKVVKGPISFSLKSKDGDAGSLDRGKKRALLLDDSEGEEEVPVDEKKGKADHDARKKMKEDLFPALNNKEVNNSGDEKAKKLTAEEMEAKLAEERIKDKLASAARERLAQQKREKQLQLERKRRAALFLNMLKNNPAPKVPEITEDNATKNEVAQKPGVESRLAGPTENSPKQENGETGISPTISEITSPRNGTVINLSRNHSPSAPSIPVNNTVGNDKWSSSSSSSSSSDNGSERHSRSRSKELSPGVKHKKLKQKLEQKMKKKKRKKHHSSRNESHKEHRKHSSKSRARSRSHGRHKSHKQSKSRSHKHKRSRSRSPHSKKPKVLPAAYTVSKKSRSRSRSPRRHRPSSRLSPHRMRRKL